LAVKGPRAGAAADAAREGICSSVSEELKTMAKHHRPLRLLGIAAGRGARVPGAEDGPFALRRQGLVQRLIHCGCVVEDLGDVPGVYETRFAYEPEAGINHLRNILQVNRHTHACVLGTRTREPEAFLLIVGGDHSLAIGTLAGLADACARLGIIWIDAHADFNTHVTSPSGNAHGMSLATACGYGYRALRELAGRDPMVRADDVHLFGCRELDALEKALLSKSGIRRLSAGQWQATGVTDAVLTAARDLRSRCDHVHLSFDIDVLDPPLVPGTGTPVAAGLPRGPILEMLQQLGRSALIDSAEFVEYNPLLDQEDRTARLVLQLIETFFACGYRTDSPVSRTQRG
jgi:arginase